MENPQVLLLVCRVQPPKLLSLNPPFRVIYDMDQLPQTPDSVNPAVATAIAAENQILPLNKGFNGGDHDHARALHGCRCMHAWAQSLPFQPVPLRVFRQGWANIHHFPSGNVGL